MSDLEVLSAYAETRLESYALIDDASAMKALARAHACYQDREQWIPGHLRVAILERLAGAITERADELAKQAAEEGGKPLVDSLLEIKRGVEGIKTAIHELWQLRGEEVRMDMTPASAGRAAYTYREPRGVVLAISAFNHPFNLIIHQVITAVAAGCPVLVKPALTTPISCEAIVNLLHEAGLPPDWCQMLICDNDVTAKLVSDSRVSFLTFIGSAPVGWMLRSKLAPGTGCALEHGGVAPAIVHRDADIDDAVPLLVKGGFYHAGQVCVSVQRIYAHEEIFDELKKKLVAGTVALTVGDPLDPSTDVGPLILAREVERVESWVREAVEGGGSLLCGGERISRTCYAPTIVEEPPGDARLSSAEIFGPVVALYRYSDLDDAIRRANAPDTFFQASIFTRDLDLALDVSRRLNGMAVMVNDHTAFRVDWMPFGGHRQSGLGLGGIGHSIREMTLERMTVIRRRERE